MEIKFGETCGSIVRKSKKEYNARMVDPTAELKFKLKISNYEIIVINRAPGKKNEGQREEHKEDSEDGHHQVQNAFAREQFSGNFVRAKNPASFVSFFLSFIVVWRFRLYIAFFLIL